jgi:methionine-rich copper-binding protein CopC
MKLLRAFLAVCTACVVLAAHAHPLLQRAEPKVGSVVPAAPAELKIWFSEALDASSSTVEVTGADGARVDTGRAQGDPADPMLLIAGLGQLGPGEYTVVWRAVAADKHATHGRFTFRVGR